MTGWELHNPMEVLREANGSRADDLQNFLRQYSLSAVNEDYTILLILRKFQAQFWQNKRRVLNCIPEGGNSQWGITVVTRLRDGATGMHNVYVPNNLTYTAIKIVGTEITIQAEELTKITNLAELNKKLSFYGEFEEAEVAQAFANLTNEVCPVKQPRKPIVEERVLESPVFGQLRYNEEYERYEGNYSIEKQPVSVSIHVSDDGEVKDISKRAENWVLNKLYEEVFLEMEQHMLALKNDAWLDDDEKPVTTKKFRRKVALGSITFYNNFTSSMYYEDGDIFGGHWIVVDVDETGKYKSATLAG